MIVTEELLKEFRKDFAKAVECLQEKYDATISIGRITYNPEDNRFSTRMEVKNMRDKELLARADFDADVWKYEEYGLTRGMYGRVGLGCDGEKYAIIGFNTRAPKYPFKLIRLSDGQRTRSGTRFITEFYDEYYAVDAVFEDAVKSLPGE